MKYTPYARLPVYLSVESVNSVCIQVGYITTWANSLGRGLFR